MNTEEWTKAVENMAETWNRVMVGLQEAADRLAKALDKIFNSLREEEQKKRVTTPCQYGMSLLSRRKIDSWRRPCWVNYMPVAPKNRPYQRRNF